MHVAQNAPVSHFGRACTCAVRAARRAAETLRVGKAVPEAFSFTPLDIGIRKGFFKNNGLDIEGSRLPATPSCSRRWRRTVHRHGARLRPGVGLHRQRLADQGRRRHGGTAAVARHRGAAGRPQDRRRPQGQEDQRLDRGLADLLAGQRNLAPPGLGAATASTSSRWAPWPGRSPPSSAATSTA